MRPCRGIRVRDAGQGIAGPWCGMMLAACAAAAIKLEPAEGERSRGLGSATEGVSVMTVAFNRGKRSVVLDLTSDEGRAAAANLLTHRIGEWGYQGKPAASPNAPAGAHQAADGAWVMVKLVREAEWLTICDVLEIPDARTDLRFTSFPLRWENREALHVIVRAAFAATLRARFAAFLRDQAGVMPSLRTSAP